MLSQSGVTKTVAEALISLPGWTLASRDCEFPTAWLQLCHHEYYQIAFVVSDLGAYLSFKVSAQLTLPGEDNPDLSNSMTEMLPRLCVQQNLDWNLWVYESDKQTKVQLVFGYRWYCSREMLTPPLLIKTSRLLSTLAKQMSVPILALVPLISLYLRGCMKDEEAFMVSAASQLEFSTCLSAGHA